MNKELYFKSLTTACSEIIVWLDDKANEQISKNLGVSDCYEKIIKDLKGDLCKVPKFMEEKMNEKKFESVPKKLADKWKTDSFIINIAKHEKMPLEHKIDYKEIDAREMLEKQKEDGYLLRERIHNELDSLDKDGLIN